MMRRVRNFAPGPSALPLSVLEQIQRELLDWQGLGVSVLELSHRSEPFRQFLETAEADFRELYQIPANYRVLFLCGGARIQFAMLPLNIAKSGLPGLYVDTGFWSHLAYLEGKKYLEARVVASAAASEYRAVPPVSSWELPSSASFLHYTPNETLIGLQFAEIPKISSEIPLVADCTSCVLSEPLDVSQFGMIYAATPKNLGVAGLTVVVVREDLIQQPSPLTPSAFNYLLQDQHHSLYLTPPVFAMYVMGLMLSWCKQQGGLAALATISERKAKRLYQVIDSTPLYVNQVEPAFRSKTNICFNLRDVSLYESFFAESVALDLCYLKGHAEAGGCRASVYNATDEMAVEALAQFMIDFAKRKG